MKHHYEILGLKLGASFEEIKRAYKLQVKKWHPDRFPNEAKHLQKKAHEKFQKISEAFSELETFHQNSSTSKFDQDQPDADFQRSRTEPGAVYDEDDTSTRQEGHSESTTDPNAPNFHTRTWPNGDKYEGQMSNDLMHGMGIYNSSQGYTYTGQFRHGKPHGQGKLVYGNGDTYTGDFVEDRMEGQGTYVYANGDRYIGQFKQDLPHGEGAHILSTGKVYAGMWENGYLVS